MNVKNIFFNTSENRPFFANSPTRSTSSFSYSKALRGLGTIFVDKAWAFVSSSLFDCRDNKKNDNKILKIATEFLRSESLDRKLTCSFVANRIKSVDMPGHDIGPDSIRTSPVRGDIKLNLCMFYTIHATRAKKTFAYHILIGWL